MRVAFTHGYEQVTHALWANHFQQTAVAQLQTSVLMSFEGVLDRRSGRAICSRIRGLLELCVEPIFIDLSGVKAVDYDGARHLTEMLEYADEVGGSVAILDTSDAIEAYVRAQQVPSPNGNPLNHSRASSADQEGINHGHG